MAEPWENNDRDADDRDPVIDACLAEILGGERLPDLTERILASLRSSQFAGAAPADTAPADTAEAPDVRAPLAASLAAATGPGAERNGHPAAAPYAKPVAQRLPAARRPWWQTIATVAAVLLVGAGLGLAALYVSNSKGPVEQLVKQPVRVIRPGPEKTPEADAADGRDEAQLAQATPNQATPNQNNAASDSSQVSSADVAVTPNTVAQEQPATVVTVELPKTSWPAPIDERELLASIDQGIQQSWQQNNLQPASPADDAVWCRRVFVRVLGRIPTVEEVRRFTSDTSEDKYTRLVDLLHNSTEYADEYAAHWANFWTSVLIGQNAVGRTNLANRDGLRSYLLQAIRHNKAFDRLVYELVSATGAAKAGDAEFNGAVNFLLANHSEDRTAETSAISRVFLGQRLHCVQCHDHPVNEAIAQARFWQFDSLLRQLHVERSEQNIKLVDRDIPDDPVFYEELDGYKRAAEPVLPDGTELPKSGRVGDVNRREVLARYVAQSPQLAESIVNRTWSHFFGFGFTTPIDDLGAHNSPSHPDVLKQLSEQFAAHGFNHRHLTQWIALTDAFRRSSDSAEGNLADAPQFGGPAWFSRYYSRQMQPEAIFQSLQLMAESRRSGGDALPAFLGQFNPNQPHDVHQPPAEPQKTVLPFTGPLVQRAVSSESGAVLRKVIKSDMSPEEKIEHLFLAAVARQPQKSELDLSLKMINDSGAEVALQDIWWALLNSSEFILDH